MIVNLPDSTEASTTNTPQKTRCSANLTRRVPLWLQSVPEQVARDKGPLKRWRGIGLQIVSLNFLF